MTLYDKSIAVLPFVNMSSDADNEYFSDGITEEIINALTAIKHLKVTARTSSFAFKGRATDVRSIGQQLGVITVLEGSVRKAGNRVRITAQLVRTDDGFNCGRGLLIEIWKTYLRCRMRLAYQSPTKSERILVT